MWTSKIPTSYKPNGEDEDFDYLERISSKFDE